MGFMMRYLAQAVDQKQGRASGRGAMLLVCCAALLAITPVPTQSQTQQSFKIYLPFSEVERPPCNIGAVGPALYAVREWRVTGRISYADVSSFTVPGGNDTISANVNHTLSIDAKLYKTVSTPQLHRWEEKDGLGNYLSANNLMRQTVNGENFDYIAGDRRNATVPEIVLTFLPPPTLNGDCYFIFTARAEAQMPMTVKGAPSATNISMCAKLSQPVDFVSSPSPLILPFERLDAPVYILKSDRQLASTLNATLVGTCPLFEAVAPDVFTSNLAIGLDNGVVLGPRSQGDLPLNTKGEIKLVLVPVF